MTLGQASCQSIADKSCDFYAGEKLFVKVSSPAPLYKTF